MALVISSHGFDCLLYFPCFPCVIICKRYFMFYFVVLSPHVSCFELPVFVVVPAQ